METATVPDEDVVLLDDLDPDDEALEGVLDAAEDWDDDTSPDPVATASEALADPFAVVAAAKQAPYEAPEVDLDTLRIGQGKATVDVVEAVLDAIVERTIEGASTFEAVLNDPDGTLRRSKITAATINVHIDGFAYRCSNVHKDGTQLTIVFEPLPIALLRRKKGFKRAWRKTHKGGKGVTRAEFIYSLVREIQKPRIPVSIPELHDVKRIEKFSAKKKSTSRSTRSRGQGLDTSLTIKGKDITSAQMSNLERGLQAADNIEGVSKKAYEALVVAGIGESDWKVQMNQAGSKYGGVLQGNVGGGVFKIDDVEGMVKSFLKGGKGYQSGGAIKLAKQKGETPGSIALKVEGSRSNFGSFAQGEHFYQQHIKEARAILKAWGQGTAGSLVSYSRTKKFAFKRGKDENSWDCIQNLAQEENSAGEPLGWRAFVVGNRFYYVSEQWLLKQRSRMTLSEDSPGVDTIDYEYDRGHPVAEVTIICRARFWTAAPGTVVTLKDVAIQVDGRWLVSTISRRRGDLNTTITLKKPQREMPEPAPEVEDKSENISSSGSGKSWKKLKQGVTYPLPIRGKDIGGVAAHGGRAWGNWQSDHAVDIAVPMDTAVYATEAGTIKKLGGSWKSRNDNPNGWNVTLAGLVDNWFYTHLHKRVPLKVGQQVKAGDLLGYSGAANGVDHLHIASQQHDPEVLLGWRDPLINKGGGPRGTGRP